jgi:hypothetical protein
LRHEEGGIFVQEIPIEAAEKRRRSTAITGTA